MKGLKLRLHVGVGPKTKDGTRPYAPQTIMVGRIATNPTTAEPALFMSPRAYTMDALMNALVDAETVRIELIDENNRKFSVWTEEGKRQW